MSKLDEIAYQVVKAKNTKSNVLRALAKGLESDPDFYGKSSWAEDLEDRIMVLGMKEEEIIFRHHITAKVLAKAMREVVRIREIMEGMKGG